LSAVGSGTVAQEINGALRQLLVSCPEAVLVGEDLHDPYGGAFKITKGLSTDFPDRVLSSPISEAGIVGAAIGLSMEGHRPVVEIMFADFLLLCMDQIYNHAVKIPWVYPVGCLPLVIRSPGGGNRGYGPTHSQCVEDVFCQVPGLTVVAPSHRHDVGGLLTRAVLFWPYPTLFVEDKLLYGQKRDQGRYEVLAVRAQEWPHDLFPTLVRPAGPDPDLTCVAYGGQLPLVEAVADSLASEEEIQVEVIVPSLLSPLPVDSVVGHLCRRRRILVVQGTPGCGGFGAELLAELAAKGFRGRAARSGAARTPIPASRAAERQVLPQFDSVREAALALFSEKSGDHG
jgi:2-oxoisovalerate dehydrogenase E1 component